MPDGYAIYNTALTVIKHPTPPVSNDNSNVTYAFGFLMFTPRLLCFLPELSKAARNHVRNKQGLID